MTAMLRRQPKDKIRLGMDAQLSRLRDEFTETQSNQEIVSSSNVCHDNLYEAMTVSVLIDMGPNTLNAQGSDRN
jgi:hypothetical protein